eukprot:1856401-Pyramimonas_sp.AAC.1
MASMIVAAVIVPAKRRLSARAKCFLDCVNLQTILLAKFTLYRTARIALANMGHSLVSAVRLHFGQPALARGGLRLTV